MTLHEELVKKWDVLEFGVKSRVKNEYDGQMILYIIDRPNYKNTEKLKAILESIERHSKEVLEEITEMYNQVTG